MSSTMNTILVLGATSGIGEAFARHYHGQGKKIIACARRTSRLEALQKELPGLEIATLDVSDIAALPTALNDILSKYPEIDTVFALAGKMELANFRKSNSTSPEKIASEITTNLTATIVAAHTVIPHFMALGRPTTFMTCSSGLAYIPLPFYPIYVATKAGIHNFSVALRSQMAGTNVKVCLLFRHLRSFILPQSLSSVKGVVLISTLGSGVGASESRYRIR
jgi:uncharacterized oxidoreductase